MDRRTYLAVVACLATGVALASLVFRNAGIEASDSAPNWSQIKVTPEGALSPGAAAKSLLGACAARSPRKFLQHLCLGVCDGPVDCVNKYAECLHLTRFHGETGEFTVYELPQRIKEDTARVVEAAPFDTTDIKVERLIAFSAVSTYYGEEFRCLKIAAEDWDGNRFHSRVVVTRIKDRWYAIPRCRSSKAFYEIADEMNLVPATMEK